MGAGWTSGTCPACGRGDWCQQHESGVCMCRRGPFPGAVERRDRHGIPYWIRWGVGNRPLRVERRPSPEQAKPQVLHRIYCTLLGNLFLAEPHRERLLARGISKEAIQRHGFRSWPAEWTERQRLASLLYREFGDDCRGLPGWFVSGTKPMLAGGSGWVLPVWDLQGRVVAIRVRSDLPGGTRYYWLSSARRGGPGPGIYPRVAWPHRQMRQGDTAETVRLVEGEAAAIVCAEHTGLPTISSPGVGAWRKCLPWLRLLETKRVLLAFDVDWRDNRFVARSLLDARSSLAAEGYSVQFESWGGDAGVA